MITREQWQRIKAVFHSAQECPPAERAGFLNQACGDDELIRQEVESLLAADEINEDFLGAPAHELMAGVLADKKAEFAAGQEVGPYTILSSLGAGGMGEVYLAKDARLGRKVALKLLPLDFARDHGRVRRFEQEARAASALNHPNVCVIHEIGQTDNGRHFIAMEYIEGLTLRARMAQKQMKLLEALDVAAQVAWALEAAHAAGIVHRDIKPENIMLRKDGYVKVLDFGIAKLNERLSKLNDINEASTIDKVQTEPGMRIGTVNYMSPEQLRETSVDARTDIWSLGVVLHEMVTGTTPFGARTTNETIAAILDRQPIEFAPPSNEVPAAFQHIVKRALGKKRRERYQRVKDLADDLRKLRRQIDTKAPQEFSAQTDSPEQPAEDSSPPVAVDGSGRSGTLERAKSLAVRTAESILSEIKEHPKATTLAGLTAVVVLLLIAPNLPRLSSRLKSLLSPSSQQSEPSLQTTRMTPMTNSGTSVCAAISPDGKSFAHAEKKKGKQELLLTNMANGGEAVVVAAGDLKYRGIVFSPDANYLYFTTGERNEAGVLYQIALPGGTPRKVKDGVDSAVTFSPTGDQFAFVRFNRSSAEYSLIISAIDASEERAIAERRDGNTLSLSGPAWSPDGHTIACGTGKLGGQHMTLDAFSAEDGHERLIGSKQWNLVSQVVWSNEKNELIVSARERWTDPFQIWRVSYPDGAAYRLTNDATDTAYETLSLSRNGNNIVAVQNHQVSGLWVAPDGDAQRAKEIASTVGVVYGLNWISKDKLVFSSMAGNDLNISSVDADGSNRVLLTVNAGDNYTPAASPDGRLIVFASNRGGSLNIWRMASDGGDARQLTFSDANSYPTFSPDGHWVLYDNQSEGPTTIWKVPVEGGTPSQLIDHARMPAVSPDTQFLAYRHYPEGRPAEIELMPFQGGMPVRQVPITIMEWQRIQWTADSQALTYIDVAAGVSNIWSYDLVGNSKRQLTNFKTDQIYAYAWSPDFKQLASLRGAEIRDVMIVSLR